jgi:hypothetical protein
MSYVQAAHREVAEKVAGVRGRPNNKSDQLVYVWPSLLLYLWNTVQLLGNINEARLHVQL